MNGIRYYSRTDTHQHGSKNLLIEVRVCNTPPIPNQRLACGIVCGQFRIRGTSGSNGETHTVRCSNGAIPVIPGITYLTLQALGPPQPTFLMVGEVEIF